MAQKKTPLRTRLKHACFLLVPIVLFWLLLELLMLVFEPSLSKSFYMYDEELGFRVRPNTFGSNQFGFNDRDYPLERAPGTFRILFLGDSFSWIGGRDGNYTAVLERRFTEALGTHQVEVINGGFSMTNTGEQLGVLRRFGLQYQPDMVLLAFFVGNDFVDADPNGQNIVVNDTVFRFDKRKIRTLFGRPLFLKSRLYHLAKQRYLIFRETQRPGWEPPPSLDDLFVIRAVPTFSDETYMDIERFRLEICELGVTAHDYKIAYAKQCIIDMHRLLKKKGIALRVLIIPDEFQVDPVFRKRLFDTFHLDPAHFDLERPQRMLIDLLERERIPYVDLLEPFRQGSAETRIYIPNDAHWNEKGIEIAVGLLLDDLMRLKPVQALQPRAGFSRSLRSAQTNVQERSR